MDSMRFRPTSSLILPSPRMIDSRAACCGYLLVFLFWLTNVVDMVDSENNFNTDFYSRYPKYPEHCSTPSQMGKRTIPPLGAGQPSDSAQELPRTKLVHVTAILRHGARTILEGPSPNNYQCWDGYWEDPATGIWDCPLLKTMSMPPNPQRIQELEEELEVTASQQVWDTPESMFLFTKSYDALLKPQANVLNGTCELGQLILQGYDQLIKNGKLLRDTYLFKKGVYENHEEMKLFEVGGESNAATEPWSDGTQLYIRSDDSQATLVSAELLMRGLFEEDLIRSRRQKSKGEGFPTISVHTADHSRDILGGFREHCKALTELQIASDNSWEYKQFVNSREAKEVVDFLSKHLRDESGLLDCLMTTVCTDRPLPDRFQIYNPHPRSWFNRIVTYHAKNYSFHLNYNDAEFSKLSMGPLWAEMLDNIRPVLDQVMDTSDRARPPAKLAIYSGYDSTIMEVLASLGAWEGDEWPPYASMVLIEIHELLDGRRDKSIFDTQFAFRLLYNGKVLTDKVKGCSSGLELCDTKHLINRVEPFARRNVNCIDVNLERGNIHPAQIARRLLTTTGGIILMILILAMSAMLGSIAVFYHLTGSLPTEELQTLKRKVFKKRGRRNRPSSPNSLAMTNQAEMQFSDAGPPVDDFEDEPSS